MGHIFVSYSRHDLERVDGLVGKLENAGIRVWLDRDDIKAGRTWRAQIVQAIDTCDALVLVLSSHSAVSDNVRKEIDLAQDSGRTVFILRLEPVPKLPAEMRYQLVGLQYIDMQELGEESAAQQLIDTLKEHLATLKPAEEGPVRQAEVVIQGVDPSTFSTEKQEQLLDFIAEITDTPDSQLHISKLTPGSVHAFVEMPTSAAFELKARALNRDQHFRQLGIKSLRLVGDKKYINISLGVLTTTATIGALKILWMSIPSLFSSIVGITAGKVLTLTSVVVVTTAVGLTLSQTVAATPDLIPSSVPTTIPTDIPTFTATPTPQNPLVIRDTLCFNGPGYDIVSAVLAETRVELLAHGNIEGWWVIRNPIYHTPCWIMQSDLQFNPNDFSNLPIYTPQPPLAGPTRGPSDLGAPTDTTSNNMICFWWNGRRICIPRTMIPPSTPSPSPN